MPKQRGKEKLTKVGTKVEEKLWKTFHQVVDSKGMVLQFAISEALKNWIIENDPEGWADSGLSESED